MSRINDMLDFTMRPHVTQTRYNEVVEEFNANLSKTIEGEIKNRLDPGINFRGHRRVQSIRVDVTDAGSIRIQANEPGKEVVKPDQGAEVGRPVLDREDTIDDLFSASSGVPKVVESNGSLRVAFRTVRDTALFGRPQEQQDSQIKQIVDNSVQTSVVSSMEDAINSVERRYPSEKFDEEPIT